MNKLNPNKNNRTLKNVYTCETESTKGHIHLKIFGMTPSNKPVRYTIIIDWFIIPYLIKQIAKQWIEVRHRRIRECERIDKAFATPIDER